MNLLKKYILSRPALALGVLLIVTFIPFLGETLFYSKGEPREAVVAMSMLQSGDWILPVSNGTDIPYKPPMLAWLIAIFSMASGGHVTEFSSRLPSALAAILMVMAGFHYCRRYSGSTRIAMLMALITATSFEVHRAATNCRVDMLLTMFMVVGLYRLYDWYERRGSILDPCGILLLSGAVLTKGPVGALLPLMVMWILMMLRGSRFVRASWQSAVACVASLVLPALWYCAAYRQGGVEFYNLAMEENFGRLTGTMSYESHVNPWWYNVITVIAGMLPYTLLFLLSAGMARYIRLKGLLRGWRHRIAEAGSWNVLMWLSVVVIFLFYCIPKSKRSVYLLPIYPMLAYATACYIAMLWRRKSVALKIFSGIIAGISLLLPCAFAVLRIASPAFGSRSTRLALDGLTSTPITITGVAAMVAAAVMGVVVFRAIARGMSGKEVIKRGVIATLTLYWSFSAVYQPLALRAKSNYRIAVELDEAGYGSGKRLYGWCSDPMLRFYTIDFYLDDKITALKEIPLGVTDILVGDRDFAKLKEMRNDVTYEILRDFGVKSCDMGQNILLVRSVAR